MRLAVLVISVTISVTALAGQHAAQEAAPAPELHTHHTHGRALRMRRGRGGKGRGGRGRGAASLPPGSNATLPQERCKTGGRGVWDLPLHCRRKLPCDIRAFDPGAKYNRKIVQSQKKAWAKHNVDPANRHFQNGVEWWVQRGLPPAVTEPEQLRGAKRVFVAAYFSYFWIFGSHLAAPAARAAKLKLGAAWQAQPERFVTAHGHPGSCVQDTKATIRLVVDADHSCKDSVHPMAVPYVVSRPEWLVAARLPAAAEGEAARSTLLFFRGTHPQPNPSPSPSPSPNSSRSPNPDPNREP